MEKKEKQILLVSFISSLLFAAAEFVFAIFSRSQSSLTDAVYDSCELVFIALLLFITPLFHKPVSEKRPYGYFQIETIYVIIKNVMMLSVTLSISAEVVESALSGGNTINNAQVSKFQFVLGIACSVIYIVLRRLNKNISSPTIETELLGWKLDVFYSLGMSVAFLAATYLKNTPLSFIVPYFDQIIAVLVMVFMLPEVVKVLWEAIKEVFLFSPEKALVDEIKELCNPVLERYDFQPVFYDVTKTGRHLWVAVYFQIESDVMDVAMLSEATENINREAKEKYQECTCELILVPRENNMQELEAEKNENQ